MAAEGPEQIPGLVVSGFLGSGKTTLVRHLLDCGRNLGLRTAVVSNEFGELGIDQALLGSAEPAYVELEGGCVCCRLSDDLVRTLQDLWESVRPDRVIVETSGLANPYDTLINFWREPVSGWISGDCAVVVVNAEQVRQRSHVDGVFEDQVSSADIILLNKTDLVSPEELDSVKSFIRYIEPRAPIIETVRSSVDDAVLFPPDPAALSADRRSDLMADKDHAHDQFESLVVDVATDQDALGVVEHLRGYGPLRVKGFIRTEGGVRVVQGVGERIELEKPAVEPPDGLLGKVVVIRRRED